MLKTQSGDEVLYNQICFISALIDDNSFHINEQNKAPNTMKFKIIPLKRFVFYVGSGTREFYFTFETKEEAEKQRKIIARKARLFAKWFWYRWFVG